jgi:hypothetical protein
MTLSVDQANFLALHVKRIVFMWQWVFSDAMLRASSGRRSIAIRRAELDDLIERGLMIRGSGAADVHPTADGVAALEGTT